MENIKTITAHTQEELDKIPSKFDGQVVVDGGAIFEPILIIQGKHKHIKAINNSVVKIDCIFSWTSENKDDYIITLHDNAFAQVYNFSQVVAYDKSKVKAYDSSIIVANDETEVYAKDESFVVAFNKSSIDAEDYTSIIDETEGTIFAKKHSCVLTLQKSDLHLFDNAKIVENFTKLLANPIRIEEYNKLSTNNF